MTIKQMRQATKMTQRQFADYFLIPKRTIENWESHTNPCPEYLKRLIEYKLIKEGLIEEAKPMTRYALKKGSYEISGKSTNIQFDALDNATLGVCKTLATFNTREEAREELAKHRTTHTVHSYNSHKLILGECFFIEEEVKNPDFDVEIDSEWEAWEPTGNCDPAEIE